MAASAPAPASGAAPPAEDKPHIEVASPALVITGVMLASMMQLIDATIANVAIPHMQTTLGAAPDTITWVLTSYIIASAVALPITGWLGDRIGIRRLILGSIGAFVVTSFACGMAQALADMVIYRTLQGVAGAFLIPVGQAVMLNITPRSKHAQMMGLWGAGVVLGPIIGPVLGGYLTEYWSWRFVFYINVPLGAIAFALLAASMPSGETRKRPFDVLGFALISAMLASLQLLLDRGPHVEWFSSQECWIYLLVCLCSAWMALVHIMTGKHPLFDRELVADRNLVVAVLFLVIVGFVMFSSMALLPPMLQGLLGYNAIDTGIILMMRGLGVIASMQLATLLLKLHVDSRILVALGFIITSWSFHMMSGWSLQVGTWELVSSGLVQGLGIGFVFIPLNTLAFATLAPHLRTEASSITNLARSVGSSVGIAVMAFLLSRSIQISHADLGSHLTAGSSSAVDLSSLDRFQGLGSAGFALMDLEVNRQAAMIGYINDYYMLMWLVLAAVPMIALMKKPAPRPQR